MIKTIIYPILILQFFISQSWSQTFDLGKFSVGESRIQVDFNDFLIHTQNPNILAKWVPNTVQWIRNENNLMQPRALLRIVVKKDSPIIHIDYKNKVLIPFKKNASMYETELYLDLFNPGVVSVFAGNELMDKISIEAKPTKIARSKQLIDYSCSSYNLKIEGIDNEYVSIGCKMNQLSNNGKVFPFLEINLSSPNIETINGSPTPYSINLQDSSPVEILVKSIDKNQKKLIIQANIPSRLYRFKTSIGFGPYIYQSEYNGETQKSNFAPSVMLYAKYDLTQTASIKAFDALLYSKSLFNNSGLYFSYDLAEALDGRVLLNALIGFQGLHYKHSSISPSEFHLIYPQGFEVLYKHAFIENYNLFYGMFFSTSTQPYTNAWLRYGKRNFLELNYIDWGSDDTLKHSHIKMWGLSVGLPFFSAL